MIEVVKASKEHIKRLSEHMRKADVDEVFAATGASPRGALVQALALSPAAYTVLMDGVPVCIFGCSRFSALSNVGNPWLLCTREVEAFPNRFLRASRAFVQEWAKRFSRLENHVDSRNELSIRWLKWLGFTILDAKPYGHTGVPFHQFFMESKT